MYMVILGSFGLSLKQHSCSAAFLTYRHKLLGWRSKQAPREAYLTAGFEWRHAPRPQLFNLMSRTAAPSLAVASAGLDSEHLGCSDGAGNKSDIKAGCSAFSRSSPSMSSSKNDSPQPKAYLGLQQWPQASTTFGMLYCPKLLLCRIQGPNPTSADQPADFGLLAAIKGSKRSGNCTSCD